MVDPTTQLIVDTARFTAATITLLLLIRIIYVISANPIGEFTAELMYLRAKDIRNITITTLLILLIQTTEHTLPLLTQQNLILPLPNLLLWLDLTQAILIMTTTILTALLVGRYTHRALDKRIRQSMETLAYLEQQRRRRRNVQRGDWDTQDEE